MPQGRLGGPGVDHDGGDVAKVRGVAGYEACTMGEDDAGNHGIAKFTDPAFSSADGREIRRQAGSFFVENCDAMLQPIEQSLKSL